MLDAPETVWAPFLLYFTFVSLSVCIAMIDLDHTIIPHSLSLPGIALGVASPWLLGLLFSPARLTALWPPLTPERLLDRRGSRAR